MSESKKGFVSPEFCPLECSTGRVECLTDEPGVFLQIRVSSEKPSQNIKLYLLPKKFLSNFSFGHMDFVLDTLVENFSHKSGISSFKSRKECQTYFKTKNKFVSKLFSGHMECCVDNSAKNNSPGNRQLLAHCPKIKKFCFLPKLFPRSAPLGCTRRKPSWFVQFFFRSFCGREGCRLDAAGVSVF